MPTLSLCHWPPSGVLLAAFGCSRNPPAPAPTAARAELPPGQNAFPLWTNAIEHILTPRISPELRAAIRAAETNAPLDDARETLTAWLASKQDACRLVEQALEMRLQFPDPIQTDGGWKDSGAISGWMQLPSLKIITGRLHVEQGEFEAAARDYLDIIRQSKRMAAGESTTLMYFLSANIQSRGLAMLRRLCADDRVSAAWLRSLLERVPDAPDADADLAAAFANDLVLLSSMTRAAKNRPAGGSFADRTKNRLYTLQVNVASTEALAADLYRRYQANAMCAALAACGRMPVPAHKGNSIEDAMSASLFGESWPKIMKDTFTRTNRIGAMLIDSAVRSADGALRISFRTRAHRNLTRTAIALRILQLETGGYPVSLDALVGHGILERLPVDPANGQPFRYDAERRLIWSVGDNGMDDGGNERTDWTVRLPE